MENEEVKITKFECELLLLYISQIKNNIQLLNSLNYIKGHNYAHYLSGLINHSVTFETVLNSHPYLISNKEIPTLIVCLENVINTFSANSHILEIKLCNVLISVKMHVTNLQKIVLAENNHE